MISNGEDSLYESSELLAMDITRKQLIPGIITGNDKIMLVADPKTGKSILVQQLASAIAGNHKFLGYAPIEGEHRVLYVAAEGDIDELQARGRAMGDVLPVPANRLWYWPVPTQPLNTDAGFAKLMAFGNEVRPSLIIFDPIFALMRGSMKEDDQMGALVKVVNRCQYELDCASILVHHTHRPQKADGGGYVDEGSEAYYGSFVVKAWPRALWTMTGEKDRHFVKLDCPIQRNLESKIDKWKLVLAEPNPLVFVHRIDQVNATQTAILAALSVCEATQSELAERLNKSVSTISDGLMVLKNRDMVESHKWPEVYRLKGE
ncbi:hypothetical protein CMI37_15690 [Candidatus Pacearchaeota archaeon]|nr:hypothetical protein [Candidatus Pacearchaeota archaeon]|tara:strand:+ start:165 stop:1121 length:957 start_codon:yes stop_codon:yes gene_type:complete